MQNVQNIVSLSKSHYRVFPRDTCLSFNLLRSNIHICIAGCANTFNCRQVCIFRILGIYGTCIMCIYFFISTQLISHLCLLDRREPKRVEVLLNYYSFSCELYRYCVLIFLEVEAGHLVLVLLLLKQSLY